MEFMCMIKLIPHIENSSKTIFEGKLLKPTDWVKGYWKLLLFFPIHPCIHKKA